MGHMKTGDLIIRDLRLKQVIRFIPDNCTMLDIGCGDGYLFRLLGDRLKWGVGVDKDVPVVRSANYQLLAGSFPDDFTDLQPGFEVIVMAAVMEHLPLANIPLVLSRCHQLLNPGGRLILTIPSRLAELILTWMLKIGIIAGMDLDAHTGLRWDALNRLCNPIEFDLMVHRRFEFGLNHLIVYIRQ
jgi:2-polyprenyl-3-methyl-5-hydroxy-6-metoxy-1,4-benzoquinol methylase